VDILLIARNAMQLKKYPRVLYVKQLNKMYIRANLTETVLLSSLREEKTPFEECGLVEMSEVYVTSTGNVTLEGCL